MTIAEWCRENPEAAAAEIERLSAEDEQWEKHGFVQILQERERLRAALRWCLKSAFKLDDPFCFDSPEAKPAGVIDTLEFVRTQILTRPGPGRQHEFHGVEALAVLHDVEGMRSVLVEVRRRLHQMKERHIPGLFTDEMGRLGQLMSSVLGSELGSHEGNATSPEAVSARIPASVNPATRIEIHPSEWLAMEEEMERLRVALRGSPCTCTSEGRMSCPPRSDDYCVRHWCARCRELGYDK